MLKIEKAQFIIQYAQRLFVCIFYIKVVIACLQIYTARNTLVDRILIKMFDFSQ